MERTTSTGSSDTFEQLVGDLDYPLFVVTAAAGDEVAGCLVGFATQSSIDPPRLTVWISETNRTAEVAARASTLVVHFLRETDEPLATRFGSETGDDIDKFAQTPWEPAADGTPVIGGCDHLIGRIVNRIEGVGDHRGYVLAPEGGRRLHAGLPQLGFQRVRGMRPGHPA